MAAEHLQLNDFVHAARPATLRVLYGRDGWFAKDGDVTLQRPDGSNHFADLPELLGVLASVGIRRCVVEWDGLEPRLDVGRDQAPGLEGYFNA